MRLTTSIALVGCNCLPKQLKPFMENTELIYGKYLKDQRGLYDAHEFERSGRKLRPIDIDNGQIMTSPIDRQRQRQAMIDQMTPLYNQHWTPQEHINDLELQRRYGHERRRHYQPRKVGIDR